MTTDITAAWDLFIDESDEETAELPQSVCHVVAW
jgi:hypothetical protein